MYRRNLSSILVMAIALAFGVQLRAQSPAPTKAADAPRSAPKRDLSGVWLLARGQPGDNDVFTTEPAPMQPWADEIFRYNLRPYDDELRARDETNPQIRCIPYTFPRVVIAGARPFEILPPVPGRVVILYERDHWVRQIWMDQQPPADYPPSFMGYSTGRWDGDTLVVDTIHLRGKNNWLDSAGHLVSDAMHITERYQRTAQDTLVINYRFEDPKVYTKPWTGQRAFKLQPSRPGFPGIMEDVMCEDPLGKGGQ
ncbi:MAG: hypothetical protein HW398_719 [Acidobacteria bacterium]|nr:hypothetical protein [Acidobacteriota bacterium]